MKSVMKHMFARVPKAQIERSSFDRSFSHKSTFNAGKIVPLFVQEAVPGDTFNVKVSAFARLATPIKPIMDNMFFETFFFSVPYRLVWDNWVKMQGEQVNPTDSTDFLVPQIVAPAVTGFEQGTNMDYFGLPTGIPNISVSALPFRALNLIYNTWFRDQNVCNSTIVDKDDGPDNYLDYKDLLPIYKMHDYFTSCLPWTQKHSDVLLPIGNTAPIITNNQNIRLKDSGGAGERGMVAAATNNVVGTDGVAIAAGNPLQFGSQTGLVADLATATSAKINAIREAFQLQRLFERDARGGTRYPEIIKSHFLVEDPSYAVLQRPEYLGGGKTSVNIHPVPQTSGTGTYTDTPAGDLSAYGTFSTSNHGFTKSFTEHCFVIAVMAVRTDLHYQQGIDRMWSRRTRYDHYMPVLAHLGEQAVLNKEIYADGTITDDGVFGYQERWAEMRYTRSMVTNKMRSSDPQSLDVWHLAQDFASLPTLNQAFLSENPPLDRCLAVTGEPHFIFDSYIKMICARPMPMYSVPGMIDHF